MARTSRLPRAFFRRPTLVVARELIGQRLVRLDGGRRLSGWIVEAEAYIGQEDQACHARAGLTRRNEVMWAAPGHAYVYFTYGMHWCLNVVTEPDGQPAAVLLRALAPAEGVATMRRRRALRRRVPSGRVAGAARRSGRAPNSTEGLTDGPAKLCQALGIDRRFNGHDLCSPAARLFIERAPAVPARAVLRGPRIGLDGVPEPWKSRPWRFRLEPRSFPRAWSPRDSTSTEENA
jgi:DNA-3-methyladenine glycosylase